VSVDDEIDAIIRCDKTSCSVSEEVQKCTVDEPKLLLPGNYCYQKVMDRNEINLVVQPFTIDSEPIDANNHNITSVISGVNYRFITINTGNFPGIIGITSTLFQVKSNAITRVVDDSVYIINSRNEQVESVGGVVAIDSTYSIYTCTSSTQLCTKITSCITETYLFDEVNNKGYLCTGSTVKLIEEEGFYVDGSYIVNKVLTPAILKCTNTGDCQRHIPSETYFLNAGYDKDSHALIYCSGKHCKTQEAAIGYYRADFGESGVIVCISMTICKISSLRYNYYINSGENKSIQPIIDCDRYGHCDTKKATVGYYLVQENSNILINCKSASNCEVEEASVGYYYNSANNDNTTDVETVIKCSLSSYTNSIICITEKKNEGFYISGSNSNVLVNCMGNKCKSVTVENGIFRSASTIRTSANNVYSQGRDKYSHDSLVNDSDEFIDRIGRTDYLETIEQEGNVMLRISEKSLLARAVSRSDSVSTLIVCNNNVCSELTAEELLAIPICTYNNDVCYLDNSNVSFTSTSTTTNNNIITSVVAGDYCTDSTRSILYFATETIVENDEVYSVVTPNSKTTKNCIRASSQYSSNLFTIGNKIYKVNDGLIMEVYDAGYYFINVNKNILVYGTEINDYNNSNVLLYKCDGKSCRIMDNPSSTTYYTDVTKKILKYSLEDNKYSFVSKKDNICAFINNTCTPKYDVEANDFCITADGQIVVVGEKILSRETGRCYMSNSITENALAYSHNGILYLLNSNAAKKVVTSGYYFAENTNYYSAEYKSFNITTSGITLYGCIHQNCQIYEPQPDIYYFDMLTNYLIQKKGKEWISPSKVGYIQVSIHPDETYIYNYKISDTKELLLVKSNKSGYYYTIDRKMYYCDVGIKTCKEIEDSDYILTIANELYYCVVDSEGEETECFKRICTTGQIYYIKNRYYRCSSGSHFELVRSRTCSHSEIVVINFPLIYSETFPIGVYNSISNIAKNNHYVPTHKLSRNSLETIQGVFTNCTYDAYDEYVTYDQICMQNYVKLNQDNEPDICNVKVLGYTYCTVEDGDDPDKCNPSSALSYRIISSWHKLPLSLLLPLFLIIIIFF